MSDEFRQHVELVRDCLESAAMFDVAEHQASVLTSTMQARGLLAAHPPKLDPNRVMSAITFLLGQVHAARLGRDEVTADTVELAAQSMRQGLGEDVASGQVGSRSARLHGAMFEMVQGAELAKLAEIARGYDTVEEVVGLLTHFADIHREVAMNVDMETGRLYPDDEVGSGEIGGSRDEEEQ